MPNWSGSKQKCCGNNQKHLKKKQEFQFCKSFSNFLNYEKLRACEVKTSLSISKVYQNLKQESLTF